MFDPTAPGALLVNGLQWQDGQGKLASGRVVSPVVRCGWLRARLQTYIFVMFCTGTNQAIK